MSRNHIARRVGIAVCVLTPMLTLISLAGPASGQSVDYCSQIPIVQGIPPWGFNTGQPISGPTGSYARGHGQINLTRTPSPGFSARSSVFPTSPIA